MLCGERPLPSPPLPSPSPSPLTLCRWREGRRVAGKVGEGGGKKSKRSMGINVSRCDTGEGGREAGGLEKSDIKG